jgi:hypothetical protein
MGKRIEISSNYKELSKQRRKLLLEEIGKHLATIYLESIIKKTEGTELFDNGVVES